MRNLSDSRTAWQLNLTPPRHVPVAAWCRGGIVESVHHGSVVLTGPDGRPDLVAGDPDADCYPRSALKPLQAVAMLRHGLDLDDELLALATASHSGAAEHLDGARRILARYGLDPDALRNTPALPYGRAEREAWLRAGGGPARLAQNCSGKHAAMLATCRVNGWSTDDYLDHRHPLQRAIRACVEQLTAEPVRAAAVDGCGAPAFVTGLGGLARAFGRLAAAEPGTAERRVADAMRTHPQYVGGVGRDVTDAMLAQPGLLAKEGAEAVQAIGLPDGTGLAVKIADGGDRARLPVAVRVLRLAGLAGPGLCAVAARGDDPAGAHLMTLDLATGGPL